MERTAAWILESYPVFVGVCFISQMRGGQCNTSNTFYNLPFGYRDTYRLVQHDVFMPWCSGHRGQVQHHIGTRSQTQIHTRNKQTNNLNHQFVLNYHDLVHRLAAAGTSSSSSVIDLQSLSSKQVSSQNSNASIHVCTIQAKTPVKCTHNSEPR